MIFTWDEVKNRINWQKHAVSFELAAFVFNDPYIISVPDERFDYTEERWQSVGSINAVVLYVAHETGENEHGEETIRIISARKATKKEEQRYYTYGHA